MTVRLPLVSLPPSFHPFPGALMRDARIPMREWASAYRTPYWAHKDIFDWSGAAQGNTVPVERVLFSPIQWLYTPSITMCCVPDCQVRKVVERYPRGTRIMCRYTRQLQEKNASIWSKLQLAMYGDRPPPAHGCCAPKANGSAELQRLVQERANWSVPPSALDVQLALASQRVRASLWARRSSCTLSGAKIIDARDPPEAAAVELASDALAQAEHGMRAH